MTATCRIGLALCAASLPSQGGRPETGAGWLGHGERSAQAPAIRHPDGSHRIVLALLVGILWPVLAAAQAPPQLDVEGVLLTAIAAVEVPAQEPGVLVAVEVREGRTVSEDTLLARIADKDAQIALARAEVELQMARKKVANDVNIRFARKSAEVAKAELQRTHESRQLYAKSISDSEVDRLRLIAERATLEVEQAEYEFAMATLLL